MNYTKMQAVLPEWAIPAIVNDDRSHMNEEEDKLLDAYLSKLPVGCHIACPDEEPYFKWANDLQQLGGNVYDVTILVPKK